MSHSRRFPTAHIAIVRDALRLTASLSVLLVAVVATSLLAPSAADAQGRPLLIVPFEREQVDDAFYQRFMDQVHSDATESVEYAPVPKIEQQMNDLLFAVGCAEPDPECLQLIGESFGAEVILYGSVWRNARTTLLTVNMFDATTGTSMLDVPIEETFEQDDPDRRFDLVISTIQQIFFPYTGTITINTAEPGAEIKFDGSTVGNTETGPLELTGRPLGQHIVTARRGELEITEQVTLVHGRPAQVTIDLTSAIEETPSDYGHLFSYVSFGVGGVALIGGGVFSFLTNSANSRAEELGDISANPNLTKSDTDEADNLRNNGPTFELLQYIFYGVGTAAIVTGAVLYYFEGSSSESAGSEASRGGPLFVPVVTSDGGIGAGALFQF